MKYWRWLKMFMTWWRLPEEYRDPIGMLVLMCLPKRLADGTVRILPPPPAEGVELTAWAFPKGSRYGPGAAMMPIGPWTRLKPPEKMETKTSASGDSLRWSFNFGPTL